MVEVMGKSSKDGGGEGGGQVGKGGGKGGWIELSGTSFDLFEKFTKGEREWKEVK